MKRCKTCGERLYEKHQSHAWMVVRVTAITVYAIIFQFLVGLICFPYFYALQSSLLKDALNQSVNLGVFMTLAEMAVFYVVAKKYLMLVNEFDDSVFLVDRTNCRICRTD